MEHYRFVEEFANELVSKYGVDEDDAHKLANRIDSIIIEETERAVNSVVSEVSKEISETCELLNKYIEKSRRK